MAQHGGAVSSSAPRMVAASSGAVSRNASQSRASHPFSHLLVQQQQQQQRDRDNVITLSQPRPGLARRQNEYIDTPLKSTQQCSKPPFYSKDGHHHHHHLLNNNHILHRPNSPTTSSGTFDLHRSASFRGGEECLTTVTLPGIHRTTHTLPRDIGSFRRQPPPPLLPTSGVVTVQPPSSVTPFKTEKSSLDVTSLSSEDSASHNGDSSIICRQCRKCKCEACRNPRRPLPQKWICNNRCLCSAESCVNYCSCMCCAKCVFYHMAKDYDMDSDVSCADRPCSCDPHQRCLRFGCMGLLSLFLPCLCCYWPLRGCLKLCELCYTRCTGRGCKCPPPKILTNTGTTNSSNLSVLEQAAPEKRLLDADC